MESPLIDHRPAPIAAAIAAIRAVPFDTLEPTDWLEDLRLFATGWVGGLIFFGTFLS